jgi:hypothetical protein
MPDEIDLAQRDVLREIFVGKSEAEIEEAKAKANHERIEAAAEKKFNRRRDAGLYLLCALLVLVVFSVAVYSFLKGDKEFGKTAMLSILSAVVAYLFGKQSR